MNMEQLCNATVHPVEGDDGETLYEKYAGKALQGIMASGETIDAGRRAELAAYNLVEAMYMRRYGDKHE